MLIVFRECEAASLNCPRIYTTSQDFFHKDLSATRQFAVTRDTTEALESDVIARPEFLGIPEVGLESGG